MAIASAVGPLESQFTRPSQPGGRSNQPKAKQPQRRKLARVKTDCRVSKGLTFSIPALESSGVKGRGRMGQPRDTEEVSRRLGGRVRVRNKATGWTQVISG